MGKHLMPWCMLLRHSDRVHTELGEHLAILSAVLSDFLLDIKAKGRHLLYSCSIT
uniref:Uncharacterized protein n=1 Tax=Arundo donax TaxID=35708 RepID=A0A0A9CMN5_ARUDO